MLLLLPPRLPLTSFFYRHTGLSEQEGGTNDGNNGEGPGQIVAFARDPADGMLSKVGSIAVPQAMSVCVISR